MGFPVTEAAMRPASSLRRCFYCGQDVGADHRDDCVLIRKRVKVRLTIEYEVQEPASWDARMIEFHRNDSSWCAGNLIGELERLDAASGCLCNTEIRFECLDASGAPFLGEKS